MHKFSFLLPSACIPDSLRQSVHITNILSGIFSVLTLLLFFSLYMSFGWVNTSGYIILLAVLFLINIWINRSYYNFGRLLFCLTPVYLTLFVSIYDKWLNPQQSYITYFDSRFILLVTTILPAVSFKLYERLKLGICLASTFICLVLYDPLHALFGLDYFQRGFDATYYYHINYFVLISYFVLLFGVITLKVITERAVQHMNETLGHLNSANDQLVAKNLELTILNQALEIRTAEAVRQQEEVKISRGLITEANRLISEQQEKLWTSNQRLEETVKEKSAALMRTNQELVRHNNELRQFSYTISHNLRGPVARLLGLTDLMGRPLTHEERDEIALMIQRSGHELDGVLRDLSLIIDIRNDLYQVREKISFQEEWQKTVSMLQDQIRPDYNIVVDFENAPVVFSLRAMIQSILFNLLSNAIKYRDPERPLRVSIKTNTLPDNNIVLQVIDNGLGFNIENQRENLFKLYRRFHTHVDGKGLGLYLVKTQVDTLGGKIDVESEVNHGTTFTITLPTPPDTSKQIFFESEAAQIYYDANLNNTVIIWRRNISSIEYRRAFQTVLHTLKTYRTPGWIADLRLQGKVASEDQIWFLNTVIPEAINNGLKRIAAVGLKDPIRNDYFQRMSVRMTELGVELKVVESLEEAIAWMEEFVTAYH
ncbi:MAG: HAMP domain-containing histidine kinase [Cyclobacteriaceae bacterium]|nr:HAMP domain-containing histidine kinase [Cyclobacteriaceae bacterium]